MANEEKSSDNGSGPGAGPEPAAAPAPTRLAMLELRGMVQRNNQRWKRLILLETMAWLVAIPLGYLWLVFFLDNTVHLPMLGRILASAVFFLVLAGLLIRCFRQWRRANFTDDQVALAIERRTPGPMQNRLINSIQLARDADDPSIGDAVIEENYRQLQQVHLEQAARSLPALACAGAALLLVLVGILFWAFQRERFANAATRIFLPFARVAPVYRTLLTIEPGDIQARQGDDVTIRVRIEGRIPPTLAIFRQVRDQRVAEEIPVPRGTNQMSYTFKAVAQSFAYAVRGGDYVSPFYTIDVPMPSELKRLEASLQYPAYTRLPDRKQESAAGDLEALQGTRAELRFTFSQPIEEAAMLVEALTNSTAGIVTDSAPSRGGTYDVTHNSNAGLAVRRVALKKIGPAEFTGALGFQDVTGYQLEMAPPGHPVSRSRKYDLRVLADLAPDLQLGGIDDQTEMQIDAMLPVTLVARDDFGLNEVGLFCRAIAAPSSTEGVPSAEPTNAWRALQTWRVTGSAVAFQTNTMLSATALNGAEGETVEVTVRAQDTDPLKQGQWNAGPRLALTIGGAGTAIQRIYERILQTEAELRALIRSQEQEVEQGGQWIRKLDPDSGLRWDDKKNLDELTVAARDRARGQADLRDKTAGAARGMVEEAGTLRLGLGMLADTEMIRAVRMLESVPGKDSVQGKRAALADARLTQERVGRSLREMLAQYIEFRQDWEMANMAPFTKMLAEREQRMAAESRTYAGLPAAATEGAVRNGANRRQGKLLDLAGLAQVAFSGMGARLAAFNPVMAGAFSNAAVAFDVAGTGVRPLMRKATEDLRAGQWLEAATNQQAAVMALVALHGQLLKVQADAARQALAEVKNLAAESVENQKEIARLQPGTNVNLLAFDPEQADPGEVIRMQQLAEELKKRKQKRGEDANFDYLFEESMKGLLAGAKPTGSDFSILKLATKPTGSINSPNQSDRAGNPAKIEPLDEKFQDLVGDLLEEADELREKYETYNINKAGQGVEEGEIGKQAGDMNALSGAAATGNMKPPTQNVGGASRSGRQGARAHGAVIGEESINRRGRDEVQEGQEEVPDQAGKLKETKSSDPQKDASTGVGGKEVGTQDTSFSTKDAGEWKDEMVERMRPPQDKNQIVERQGKPLHPQIAEMMRDLTSTQEQVIERIKSIKKQLDNLYLPTDHLDDAMAQLNANLDRLRQSPDPEVFRLQMETLDKLKGAIVVFNRPASEFQPSLARPQAVRGQILDEPPWQTTPGYEEAVKRYYEKLALP